MGVALCLRPGFQTRGVEVKLSRRTAMTNEIIDIIKPGFERAFRRNILYRSTGLVLFDLGDDSVSQLDLFRRGPQNGADEEASCRSGPDNLVENIPGPCLPPGV